METLNRDTLHPCQLCGACCAFFRVEFYWREGKGVENPIGVPDTYCEDLSKNTKVMKGTNSKHNPKCIALKGRIGQIVECIIYENRPSPCRAFKASYEDGKQNERCDEARAKHGLKALRRFDWEIYNLKNAPEIEC